MNLVEISDGINTVDYRWVYNIISDFKRKVEKFKAKLAIKAFYEFSLSRI